MFPYIPNTPDDEKIMLESTGVSSVDNLFHDIPESLRLKDSLNLGKPMSEMEVRRHMKELAEKNINTEDLVCFLGAGSYDHYIPAVVNHIISRSEFYTAYTPYQPEISQGTLQAIFEYQTMIANLTGMDVSNASMYDGATACAEAARLAVENTKRKKVVVSKTVHPEIRKVLATYMHFNNTEVVEVDMNGGETDLDKLQSAAKDASSVIVQNPNFFGIIENMDEIEKITHSNKALLIMSVDPISLGILKTPGEIGADVVIGEGQSLGNSLNFGGPYLGFMASTSKLMRKLPGRIVGETIDVDGKRSYVLTLQAREQHIRRQKATSNICSNEALNALTATVYLATMGKQGIKEVAEQCAKKAHYTYNELVKTGRYEPLFDKPFFMEFALKSKAPAAKINEELLMHGVLGGLELSKYYKEFENSLLLCVTEKRTKSEIDGLVNAMEVIA